LHTPISDNTGRQVGGIYLYGYSTTINNTPISGNTSKISGGGLSFFCQNTDDTVTLENCTIANNHANYDDVITYPIKDNEEKGGGAMFGNGTFIVKNTIISNNYSGSSNAVGDDYFCNERDDSHSVVILNDEGYNIIKYQDGTSTGIGQGKTFTNATNFIYTGNGNEWVHNSDTITGTLNLDTVVADYGGPTKTLAI
jgi:hypothetical protein